MEDTGGALCPGKTLPSLRPWVFFWSFHPKPETCKQWWKWGLEMGTPLSFSIATCQGDKATG